MRARLSNCFFFAVWQKRRHPRSYVVWRDSDFYPGLHFLWARRYRDGRVVFLSLVPQGRNADGSYTGKPAPKLKRLFPPILFRGVLVRGDK